MYTKDEYLELIPDLWWTPHTRKVGASRMAVYVEQYVAEIADDSVVPECICWLRNNPEQMKRQFLALLSIDEKYNYLSQVPSLFQDKSSSVSSRLHKTIREEFISNSQTSVQVLSSRNNLRSAFLSSLSVRPDCRIHKQTSLKPQTWTWSIMQY